MLCLISRSAVSKLLLMLLFLLLHLFLCISRRFSCWAAATSFCWSCCCRFFGSWNRHLWNWASCFCYWCFPLSRFSCFFSYRCFSRWVFSYCRCLKLLNWRYFCCFFSLCYSWSILNWLRNLLLERFVHQLSLDSSSNQLSQLYFSLASA